MNKTLTALINKEDNEFVSLCPELDIASQGKTVEEARSNLKEALELFFEHASDEEISSRMMQESYVTSLEVNIPGAPIA